jgi:hypothetical protein
VQAANGQASRPGFGHLRIGTNTTPLFGPSAGFYLELVKLGGAALVDGLHYIGLDMFPDVFRPLGDKTIRTGTAGLLRYHRRDVLGPAGLGHLPLHITEHGWPTGRTDAGTTGVGNEDVIESVLEQKDDLNIAAYELFSLRDADSSNPDLFHQFGIMTDAYHPKPAYGVFRDLLKRFPRRTRLTSPRPSLDTSGQRADRAPPTRGKGTLPPVSSLSRVRVHLLSAWFQRGTGDS